MRAVPTPSLSAGDDPRLCPDHERVARGRDGRASRAPDLVGARQGSPSCGRSAKAGLTRFGDQAPPAARIPAVHTKGLHEEEGVLATGINGCSPFSISTTTRPWSSSSASSTGSTSGTSWSPHGSMSPHLNLWGFRQLSCSSWNEPERTLPSSPSLRRVTPPRVVRVETRAHLMAADVLDSMCEVTGVLGVHVPERHVGGWWRSGDSQARDPERDRAPSGSQASFLRVVVVRGRVRPDARRTQVRTTTGSVSVSVSGDLPGRSGSLPDAQGCSVGDSRAHCPMERKSTT